MSNLKPPPAWLTTATADRVMDDLDRVAATSALQTLGLSGREIRTIERIAAVRAMKPEAAAAELIRAAVQAMAKGGWDADAM